MIKLIQSKLKRKEVRVILLSWLLILIVLLPSYSRMLRYGFFSMHDFHLFRLFEYDKCLADLQIPCRWAPDAALGYGQPLFNFYAQLPYVIGEFFRMLGLSVVDSTKAVFILSLVFSAFTMYILARQIWKDNLAALVSSLVYVYAPYRAVDVYVRGALPESLAFVFFPLITYFFNDYVIKRKIRSLLFFSLTFSLLILTHNLSALMYSFFLTFWGIFMFSKYQAWKTIFSFIGAGFLSAMVVAFYILPVAGESSLISIGKTTEGYYDFRNHFVSLDQLLFSRFWGYGGSIWGDNDGMSFSIGHVQWILPLITLLLALVKFKNLGRDIYKDSNVQFLIMFTGIGVLMLFLTHYKSDPFWESLKPIAFIQFPWRFLSPALFSLSILSGALIILLRGIQLKILSALIIIFSLIALNASFFTEDIWYETDDKKELSGERYLFHAASAINDFWPLTASEIPTSYAPPGPLFIEGTGSATLAKKTSIFHEYDISAGSVPAKIQFPIVYFPGWQASINGQSFPAYPSGKLGLITLDLKETRNRINLKFENTQIRMIGNLISSVGVIIFISLLIKYRKK